MILKELLTLFISIKYLDEFGSLSCKFLKGYKINGKKTQKKGAKAPPLFLLFFVLSYISYRYVKKTKLVRQKN